MGGGVWFFVDEIKPSAWLQRLAVNAKLQRSRVRSQHPPTKWNLRDGRWSSVELFIKRKNPKKFPRFYNSFWLWIFFPACKKTRGFHDTFSLLHIKFFSLSEVFFPYGPPVLMLFEHFLSSRLKSAIFFSDSFEFFPLAVSSMGGGSSLPNLLYSLRQQPTNSLTEELTVWNHNGPRGRIAGGLEGLIGRQDTSRL